MDPLLVQLGERIQIMREIREWSQDTLARVVGATRNTIARIERGEQNPSFLLVVAIAAALEITTHDLVEGLDGERPDLLKYR